MLHSDELKRILVLSYLKEEILLLTFWKIFWKIFWKTTYFSHSVCWWLGTDISLDFFSCNYNQIVVTLKFSTVPQIVQIKWKFYTLLPTGDIWGVFHEFMSPEISRVRYILQYLIYAEFVGCVRFGDQEITCIHWIFPCHWSSNWCCVIHWQITYLIREKDHMVLFEPIFSRY